MFTSNLVAFVLSTAMAVGTVSAHGSVPLIKIGKEYIPGWNLAGQSTFLSSSTKLELKLHLEMAMLLRSQCVSSAQQKQTPALLPTYVPYEQLFFCLLTKCSADI